MGSGRSVATFRADWNRYLWIVLVAASAGVAGKSMKRGYVAIVDDDAPMREAVARLLRIHQIASQSFPSAHAFIEALSSGIPYCLIVDVDMPAMSGIDLQRELLNRGVHIATIVITAYNEAPMPKDALLGAINTAKTRE